MSGLIRTPISKARRSSCSETSSGSSSTSSISRSLRFAALAARTASSFSKAFSTSSSARTPSLLTSHGRVSPWSTRVAMITPKAMNTISSRSGNGDPSSISSGIASASATEATPRIPAHHMTTVSRHEVGISSS